MLRTIRKEDDGLAIQLIGRINRSARQIITDACKNDVIKQGLIYEHDGNKGVFVIIEKEEFFVAQISFIEDIDDSNVFKKVHTLLKGVIEKKGPKDLFLNIYGKNPRIISYFIRCGFKKDSSGIQYKRVLSKYELESQKIQSRLQFRRYEAAKIDDYIELMDEAFKSLDVACDVEPYRYRRNKEGVMKSLEEIDQNNELGTFWLNNDLVGLYILYNDYIDTIAIHPKYQRMGFGAMVLTYVLGKLFEKGYHVVYLNCLDENTQGHGFYRSNSFEEHGWFCENTYVRE